MMRWRLRLGVVCTALLIIATSWAGTIVHAASPSGDFNLQVTPSPLVTTVKPGTKTQLELKIRNGGTDTENLKIEPRAFTIGNDSTNIKLLDTTPPDIGTWISFSQPKFTVQPGQWFSEEITLTVPKSAGFSYSFALVISRQSQPAPTSGGRVINGSLAVFTLVNVDRPGATSNLQVASFSSSKRLYEYLPATFHVQFHNVGNTIAQPYGNIFVQRSANSKNPLATLTVNATKGYILPGTTRVITASWSDGFPAYHTVVNPDGSTSQKLVWDWGQLSHLRIGRYTAHLVAVYSQAGHDVPIEGTVSFWVVPWRAILCFLIVVVGLWLLARWRNKRRTEKAVQRALKAQAEAHRRSASKKDSEV
jgi:hypothetical protein